MQNQNVRAKFVKQNNGLISIEFFDPAYVRSDLISLDRDRRMHAILHEDAHFVGELEENEFDALATLDEVLLAAQHYNGSMLRLTAPLHKSTH